MKKSNNKICSKCKKPCNKNLYYKNVKNKDGLYSYCMDCYKIHSQNYYSKNSDQLTTKNTDYYYENYEKCRADQQKYYKTKRIKGK